MKNDSSVHLPRIDDLASFSKVVELIHVGCVSFGGKLFRRGDAHRFSYNVEESFSRHPGTINYRFDVSADIFDDESSDTDKKDDEQEPASLVARCEASIICEFKIAENAGEPDQSVIEEFGGVAAFRVAYPFIRESINSSYIRLGLPAITLGLLHKGEVEPREVGGRRRE